MLFSQLTAGTGICVINPCANGGACIRVGNNYTCSCAPGFNGRNCETSKFLVILYNMKDIKVINRGFCK